MTYGMQSSEQDPSARTGVRPIDPTVSPRTPDVAAPPLRSTTDSERVAPLRVLVADDCAVNQMVMSTLLSRWGIAPVIAGNGAQAVYLAGTENFDIIFMDIDMPVMDGLEATDRIRALEREHPSRLQVPVVAYTTTDIEWIDVLMRRVGMTASLKKPADADAIFQCLACWCAPRWPAAAP